MGDELNLACFFTYLRIGLVVPILALLLSPQTSFLLVGTLTAFAGLSDAIDGFLARRLRQVSTFGAILDLIADKLLVLSVLTAMSALGLIPFWVTALLFLREAVVAGLRIGVALQGDFLGPDMMGKVKTALTWVALSGLLIGQGLSQAGLTAPGSIASAVSWWLLMATLGLSLFSAANYGIGSLRHKREKREGKLTLPPLSPRIGLSREPKASRQEAR
jgi:CDP-diacylglycerol--glycerol-3-phosphate 3-phosphatidyltransferase